MVPRSHKVLKLIHSRPGEASTPFIEWRENPLANQADGAADNQPVGHVRRTQGVLVRPDDRISEVAEELIVVVQVARAVRPDIRDAEIAMLAGQKPTGCLE